MDAHSLRRRLHDALAADRLVVGTFLKLAGTAPVDLARHAGLDLVVVDLEHSLLTEADALAQVQHATAIGLPALVRLPAVDAGAVNRLLEAGAAGIQVSTVRTVAAVDALRAATRHAPDGRRSISLSHPVAAYGAAGLAAHLAAEAAAPPLCVGQIETATTDDPLADVVAGLDVAFLGTTDLSVDLGHPGDLAAAPVRARVEEIAGSARAAGVALGAWAAGPAEAATLAAAGARYLLLSSDVTLLGRALGDVVAGARAAAPSSEAS